MTDQDFFLAPPASKADPHAPKPHCQQCGRFVSAVYAPPGPSIDGDYPEATGTCKTHGRVYVSWEPV